MLLETFVSVCKDFFMLLLNCFSQIIGSLFQMDVFIKSGIGGYDITVGHILFVFIGALMIFGFLFGSILSWFGVNKE